MMCSFLKGPYFYRTTKLKNAIAKLLSAWPLGCRASENEGMWIAHLVAALTLMATSMPGLVPESVGRPRNVSLNPLWWCSTQVRSRARINQNRYFRIVKICKNLYRVLTF